MAGNLKFWRESASVILAARAKFSSPNSFNYKVLSLKRSSKSSYMPSNFVFPGGNISKSDSDPKWYRLIENFGFSLNAFNDLVPKENIPKILQSNEEVAISRHLSFRICAIRETFEESGILLCRSFKSEAKNTWTSFIEKPELSKWRSEVHNDSKKFLDLCHHFQVYPDVWALKIWRNWITPPASPATFNTIFFIANCNKMPNAEKDEKEIQDLMWTTPDEYIKMNRERKILLPPPQFYELLRLKAVQNIDHLATIAEEKALRGCESWWPHKIKTREGLYTILNGDDLYPDKIDPTLNEVPFVEALPETTVKHRMLLKDNISYELIQQNFP